MEANNKENIMYAIIDLPHAQPGRIKSAARAARDTASTVATKVKNFIHRHPNVEAVVVFSLMYVAAYVLIFILTYVALYIFFSLLILLAGS